MIKFPKIFCIVQAFYLLAISNCLAQSPGSVHCGRNAVYVTLDRLAIPCVLDDIERQLPKSGISSVGDLQRVLTEHEVSSTLVNVQLRDTSKLQAFLKNRNNAAIIMIPTDEVYEGKKLWHFVAIESVTDRQIVFFSTAENEFRAISEKIVGSNTPLPTLLCKKSPGLAESILQVIDSPSMTFMVLCIICVVSLTSFQSKIAFQGIAHSLTIMSQWARRLLSWVNLRVAIGVATCSLLAYVYYLNRPSDVSTNDFLPNEVYAGEATVGERVLATVQFSNTSNRTLAVSVAKTSCQCLSVEPKEIKVEPKSVAKFQCHLETSSTGLAAQQVLFSLSGAGENRTHLTQISYTGVDKRKVMPVEFNLGALGSWLGESKSATFMTSDPNLNIENVKIVDTDILDTFSAEIVSKQATQCEVAFKLNKRMEPGTFSFPIVFECRDQKGKPLELVSRINGEMSLPVKVIRSKWQDRSVHLEVDHASTCDAFLYPDKLNVSVNGDSDGWKYTLADKNVALARHDGKLPDLIHFLLLYEGQLLCEDVIIRPISLSKESQ